ncbi:hypothetical protein K4H00_22520 [Mycobacterium tuberculosis]|nr:hypothetical protein [Mycobacterium tuberculosis]
MPAARDTAEAEYAKADSAGVTASARAREAFAAPQPLRYTYDAGPESPKAGT